MNKIVSSFIRQALQYSRKAMKIHFQNWIKCIHKNKISKGKKHEKRKQPQEKSSTSGKKIKLTKSNTNVEQKNPTQKIMPGIISNDIEIPISIIVKYVSMRSFKRSIYFIRFFFCIQSSVTVKER